MTINVYTNNYKYNIRNDSHAETKKFSKIKDKYCKNQTDINKDAKFVLIRNYN